MIHASKTAYIAILPHRSSLGAFDAGDVVIVDEPALIDALAREGSIDPSVTVDASVYTTPKAAKGAKAADEPAAAPADGEDAHAPAPEAPAGSGPSPAARATDRMVAGSSRRGRQR